MVPRVPGPARKAIRRCARSGCRWPASASLTFAYAKRVVWIEDLTPEPHPAAYDLCAAHAERLAVPVGWAKDDLRVAPPPVTPIRPDVSAPGRGERDPSLVDATREGGTDARGSSATGA